MAQTVKIMSWNINNSSSLDEVLRHIENLHLKHTPDVIFIQELTTDSIYNQGRDAGEEIAQQLDCDYKFAKHVHKSIRFKEGVGTFTHHKIIDSNTEILNNRRALLHTDIAIDGLQFHAVNVHISAPATNPVAYKEEADNLAETLKEHSQKTVIGGDFNSHSNTTLLEELNDIFYTTGNEEPTWKLAFDKGLRLDYVFTTKDMRIIKETILEPGPSDHSPMLVEVEL